MADCHAQQPDVSRLQLPAGFKIEVFAQTGKCGPRALAWSPGGALLATCVDEGQVVAVPAPGGKPGRVATVLDDLSAPHGIAFHQGKLYVGEAHQAVAYDWDERALRARNPQKIADLPGSGGGHMTRTLVFHNRKLYVSVGSSCNVCEEDDPRRAAVLEFDLESKPQGGPKMRIFARGLRNSVGMAVNPKTNTLWAADNGSDWRGDDLPPEEINDLGAGGGDFGWPYCYGRRVADAKFGRASAQRCQATVPAKVEMQAHSAPLGLLFYQGTMFPPEYRGDLFVTFHGSWNRSVPTGYKVVRIQLDEKGEPRGGPEDFITGWVRPGETRSGQWMGRPVGLLTGSDGALYVSDDASGTIYRVTYGR